ncbi:MAG: hypothetical protein EP330_26820 [Deltaproteobacteria bacterium]|nr:MAG: hypothetical protein EP330_26820 [Deltaproteobacteria bacterium]
MTALACTAPLWLAGCVAQPAADLSWNFEARAVPGEIRVLPVIGPASDPEVILESWVGAGLTPLRTSLREARTEELLALPDAVRASLPGQVHAALDGTWEGEFRVGRYPVGGRERVQAALRTRQDLDEALGVVARASRSAVLVTWVESVDGVPLTVHSPPGETVSTSAGPVLVDLFDEPYRVEATLGCALVASDGEVVLRYQDSFETVISGTRDARAAGRTLAEELALEVAKVWPADPRLDLALLD